MTVDQELQGWLKDWQHAGTGPEVRHLDIRKRVRQQNLRMVLSLAGQLLVAAAGIAVAAFMVWRRPEPAIIFLALAICVFVFAAVGFAIWNMRGTWFPSAQSTRDFVQLSIRRCHASLRGVRFGLYLLVIELIFIVPWVLWNSSWDAVALAPWSYIARWFVVMLVPGGILFWLFWTRRRKLEELRMLLEFEQALTE